jgi:hypothetical protein
MITKEVWDGLTRTLKDQRLREALTELCDIDDGKHALSGTPEQGRLTQIRTDLEQVVLQIIEWEKPQHEENRPSPQ